MLQQNILEFFHHFLPHHLSSQAARSGESSRKVHFFSLFLLVCLGTVFLGTYFWCLQSYDREQRSLHLPSYVPWLFIVGWGFAASTFILNVRKLIFLGLPLFILCGGMFIGVMSFSFEDEFGGLSLLANLSVFLTVLTTYVMVTLRTFDLFPGFESLIITIGTSIMVLISFLISSAAHESITGTPLLISTINLSFEAKAIGMSLAAIILMAIVSLLHFRDLQTLSQRKLTLEDYFHFGTNVIFVVFTLYLSFFILFATLKAKKSS